MNNWVVVAVDRAGREEDCFVGLPSEEVAASCADTVDPKRWPYEVLIQYYDRDEEPTE